MSEMTFGDMKEIVGPFWAFTEHTIKAAIARSAILNALILFRSGYVCIYSKWANASTREHKQCVLPRELQPIGGSGQTGCIHPTKLGLSTRRTKNPLPVENVKEQFYGHCLLSFVYHLGVELRIFTGRDVLVGLFSFHDAD